MATRAEWVEQVHKWERSGLDAAEFSLREGLEPAQFDWWRRELRAPEPQRAEPQCREARVAKPGPMAPPAPAAPAWIDIPLAGGGLVRLLPGIDATTAACVLAVAAELAARRALGRLTCAWPPSRSAGVKK